MPLILPQWTPLTLKASCAVCKSVNSQFVSPSQLFLSPALKTCWTASIWDVRRPCPKLSSSLIIILPNSEPYLNEPYQCLRGSLIHLLPSLSWKISVSHRLWSVKITLWWADGLQCWEAGQLWAAVTPLLPSPPSFLPSAEDSTLASYIQPLHPWNPHLSLCVTAAPHWTHLDSCKSFLTQWWSVCLQFSPLYSGSHTLDQAMVLNCKSDDTSPS